ncbi:MAG: SDR family oxidoreductase [Pseudomonadota bacterium]
MGQLSGRSILVTGAAQGIGAAMARGFADAGAKLTLADIEDPAPAAADIPGAVAVTGDITNEADCAKMVARAVDAFGALHGLVCNAALFATLPPTPFDAIDLDEWDRVMRVNVRGTWQSVKAAVPAMAPGASIVMISTNRVYHGYPNLLHYDASKGAVMAMTRSLARELGPKGIRINAVAPGLTLSEGVLKKPGIEDREPLIVAGRALGRSQTPDDLVGAATYFLSDLSAHVTGQSLIVDGGGLMQ